MDESRVLGNGQGDELRLRRVVGHGAPGTVTGNDHRRLQHGKEIDKALGSRRADEHFAECGVADQIDNPLHELGSEAMTATVRVGWPVAELV